MQGEAAEDRTVIAISGTDRESFLQGLITNDMRKLKDGMLYAALLSPQGKYLADFFLLPTSNTILVDVAAALAPDLCRRLALYRLRADVAIETTDLHVQRGVGPPPAQAFPDPRHPALGWRRVDDRPGLPNTTDWDALRVAHLIPQSGVELIPDESYILEMGFERLDGVDFRKGCYVGQEVTARMKHKTELRKGLARVALSGPAAPGTVITSEGREAGMLHTVTGSQALAYLRFDRAQSPMQAGNITVTRA